MRWSLAVSVFLMLALTAVPLCTAQSDSGVPTDLRQLQGKIVFLRSMDNLDTLRFGAQGEQVGAHSPGAFAFSGMKIEKIHENEDELQIKGKRCALYFDTQSQSPALSDIQFVILKEPLAVTIAVDRARPGSIDAAIQKIFALTAASDLANTSPAQEAADLDTLGSTATIPMHSKYLVYRGVEPHVYKAGIKASAPKLIHAVKPVYPKRVKLSPPGAICVVSLEPVS